MLYVIHKIQEKLQNDLMNLVQKYEEKGLELDEIFYEFNTAINRLEELREEEDMHE